MSLTYSLELLFGKRLGFRLLSPIGLEWYEKGYWDVYPHPDTAAQYLSLGRADASVYDRDKVETGSGPETVDPSIYYCPDITKDIYERSITFQKFLDTPIDIFIASIPEHVTPFNRLIRRFKPKAKLIFQMGNMFPRLHFRGVRNVLNSTERRTSFYIHAVKTSQEFSLEDFFYEPPRPSRKIVAFAYYIWQDPICRQMQIKLGDFSLETYGSGNEFPGIVKTRDVAAKMREAAFIWHVKKGGDGYGHVLHNAAALGRPVIISKNTYRKLRFGKFIEDGKTCVCVDGLESEALAKKIRHYAEPDRHRSLCENIYERFRNLVDFDKDERNVRRFLENLR